MYIIAVFGDLISLIPFVNIISDPVTALALYIAGKETGVDIFGDQTMLTMATMAAEAVPVLSILPLWTLRVWWGKRRVANGETGSDA